MSSNNLSTDERDVKQRSMGFIGFSAFMHMGLLIVILLAPTMKTSKGEMVGTAPGIELSGEQVANAAPTPDVAAGSGPIEVLLADSNDPNAVALPATAKAEEAKPVAKVEEVKPVPAKPIAKIEKPAAKVRAPKVAKAAPKFEAPKAEAPKAIETQDESPVAVAVAEEKPVEPSQPEVDTAAQEAKQQAEEAATESATTESASTVAAAPEKEEAPQKIAKNDDAVPLQIALPEKEAISDEEAAALQAPKIPDDAKPIETVNTVRTSPAQPTQQTIVAPTQNATGLVIPKNAQPVAMAPARAGGLENAQTAIARQVGGAPNGAGTAIRPASAGGTAGLGSAFGSPVRDARSLIATDKPQAIYPLQDRISRHQGTTVLLGHVTNDGRVERVQLEKSSGSKLMDQSAAKAFSQWKFKPGQEGMIRLPIQFQLAGGEQIIPAQLNRQ